jgi:hypothetical protein
MKLPDTRLATLPAILRECGLSRTAFQYWSPKRSLDVVLFGTVPIKGSPADFLDKTEGLLNWNRRITGLLHLRLIPGLLTDLEDVAPRFNLAIVASDEKVITCALARNPPFNMELLARYDETDAEYISFP